MNDVEIMDELKHDIEYALKSGSLNLAYKAYGEAVMAWKLGALSKEQFFELNEMVIRNGINNPASHLK